MGTGPYDRKTCNHKIQQERLTDVRADYNVILEPFGQNLLQNFQECI